MIETFFLFLIIVSVIPISYVLLHTFYKIRHWLKEPEGKALDNLDYEKLDSEIKRIEKVEEDKENDRLRKERLKRLNKLIGT